MVHLLLKITIVWLIGSIVCGAMLSMIMMAARNGLGTFGTYALFATASVGTLTAIVLAVIW